MQPISDEIWDSKYRLKDHDGNPVDRDRGATFERIADALAGVEKHPDPWRDKFLWALENGAIPGGRIASNAGVGQHKPATSLINCTVSDDIPDDLDGIMLRLREAALTLKAGCGIGYCFSSLRPKGARVSGAGANTSGPLSFMDIYDAMCATISSAGGRRGAQMGTFAADHPDVFDFVRAKRENGRLRHFNLSVLVPDRLLDAVKNNALWPLRFPGHPESDRDVPARELWGAIMRSTYDFSEPGVLFVDRINGENNNWFAEKIEATNPCLAEGTYVATPDGYRRVETIAEGDAVLTALGTVGFVGRKEIHDDIPVYDVELSDGAVVRATAAHIFHSKPTGINSRKWGKTARLHELSSGDQLRVVDAMPGRDLTPPLCGMDERDKGFFVGVVLGDGCFTDNTTALKISVGLDQKEWCDKLREFFSGYGVSCSVYEDKTAYVITLLDGARRSLENFGLKPALSIDKVLPDFVYRAGREFLSGLVDGLVSTDGNVHMHSANPMVRVSSRSLELLRGVKRVLNMLGVHARIYACKKTDTAIDGRDIRFSGPVNVLCVLGRDIRTVAGLGITHYQRRARLEELVLDYQLSGGTRRATIKGIKPAGRARVYDLFEPNTDTWVTDGGIVSRGCGELPLPPNGSCLLGSVDLTRFVLDPFTVNARFDWPRYRDVVAIFTRMLDNVVEIANLPLPEQAEELRRKRRHGMGVLGVGSALAMLGIRYGSPGSCVMVETWMLEMALVGWRQALELAKEKGPAPIMEEEFAEHGGLKGQHLHAKSQYMRRIAEIDPGLVDALARVGARFTHHTAIAPTGTIAIAFADNASNGIEPSFAHRYVRNLTVAGRKTRQATTVYSAEALLWEKMFGDRSYPDHFVTAERVAPKEHIDVQAAAQKWVDSSVSKCVAEGTAVLTNFGILKIEDLGYASVPGEFGDPISGLKVLDFNGDWQDVTAHYFAGEQETVKIYLSNGQLIEGSPVHRLQDNFGRWKKLADLKVGDGIKSLSPSVDSLSGGETIESRYASLSASVAFPDRMSDELALWLGMWCANGSSNLNCVSFCDSSEEIIELWSSLSVDLFGKVSKPIKDKRNSVKSVTVNSKDLSTWLTNLSGRKAEGKFVPRQIMMGSKSEMLSFLRGISLDGYLHKNGTVLYDGKSKNLADGIFSICSYLGLFPRRGSKRVSGYDYSVHYVMVKGFQDCIESHKNSEIVDDRRYLVQLPESWNDFHPDTKHPGYCSWRSIRQRDQEWARPSTLDLCGFEADPNTEILKVQEIEYGFAPLYDIEVKDSHSYLIDGVISHNTINVPPDISFEEFEDLYRYAHEKKLKGCATFRYNPEVFQGVLVTEDKLAGETYRFELADGTTVVARGDQTVEYDGETHTAANLFDALKEGKYGRF